MSTKITADNGAEIKVGQLGITVDHPEGIASIWARLSPWQRRSLADALDQDAAVVIGGRLTAPESQYKRERDAAVARAEQAENARDTAATRAGQLEKALAASRDAHQRSADAHMEWKARAEAAERVLRERDEQEDDATRAACERAEQAERDRDEWKARAEAAEARTAVTREDVEKVVHGSGGGFFDSRLDAITDAVCALFGIEAEQAEDPVEEKARECLAVMFDDVTPDTATHDEVLAATRMAKHLIEQEAMR